MNALAFAPRPMDQLGAPSAAPVCDWIWHGYLARGNVTLLTSQWKAGKTTLLAGLLRALGTGGAFLDRRCATASAVVVSEEADAHWADRNRAIPIGPHAQLVSRPFPGRPTAETWDALVVRAEALRAAGALDVFAVDPLASFLPGRSDSDPGTLLDLLHPLRHLAASGVAVLILHHPRKKPADEGSTARGSGALLGFVDVILELHRHGTMAADANRRRLVGLSRHGATPASLVYEWTPGAANFRTVEDVTAVRFRENWETVRAILAGRTRPASHRELLDDWPPDRVPPSQRQLYQWLTRAVAAGSVLRTGAGTRSDPYRFRLPPEESDEPGARGLPDLTELPALRWR